MINFIVSLLLGMLPEVLYLSLFIICFRKIESKKFKLFMLLTIGYIALVMMCRYQFLFYIAYIIYSYLIIKLLYKSHIIDLFVVSVGYVYLTLISFVCFKLFNNYWLAFTINRIMLFFPLIFKTKIRLFYEKYKSLWNINKGAKIKSITIRNISLVIINLLILILNATTLMCIIDSLKFN